MLEIEKYKGENNFGIICIKTQDGYFKISFEDNFDLYWTFIPNKSILESESSYDFIITKENYYLYKAFEDLYNAVKNNMPYSNNIFNNKKDKDFKCFYEDEKQKLLIDNKINWHSDNFEYAEASSFTIAKYNDDFKATFKRSTGKCFPTFAVRISNSGSRYYPFNTSFMNMYKNLNEYNTDYHQTHIEEFIYKQKTLKRY